MKTRSGKTSPLQALETPVPKKRIRKQRSLPGKKISVDAPARSSPLRSSPVATRPRPASYVDRETQTDTYRCPDCSGSSSKRALDEDEEEEDIEMPSSKRPRSIVSLRKNSSFFASNPSLFASTHGASHPYRPVFDMYKLNERTPSAETSTPPSSSLTSRLAGSPPPQDLNPSLEAIAESVPEQPAVSVPHTPVETTGFLGRVSLRLGLSDLTSASLTSNISRYFRTPRPSLTPTPHQQPQNTPVVPHSSHGGSPESTSVSGAQTGLPQSSVERFRIESISPSSVVAESTPQARTQAQIEERCREILEQSQARAKAEMAESIAIGRPTLRGDVLDHELNQNNLDSTHEAASGMEPEPDSRPADAECSRESHTPHPNAISVQDHRDKKRKRLPTGPNGEIPPPAGASYGIDDRYIDVDYDSEASCDSDGEENQITAKKQKLHAGQTPRSVLKKGTHPGLHPNGASTRSTKRVTFNDNPIDTPTRVRVRATDPYTGIHFADPSNEYSDESTMSATGVLSPDTTANTRANTITPFINDKIPGASEGWRPTCGNPRPGQFCLDYDTYEENDSENDEEGLAGLVRVGTKIVPISSAFLYNRPPSPPAMAVEPPATPRPVHAELPTTPTKLVPTDDNMSFLSNVGNETLNEARDSTQMHASPHPSDLALTPAQEVEESQEVESVAEAQPQTYKNGRTKEEDDWYRAEAQRWADSLELPPLQTYEEAGVGEDWMFELVRSRWTDADTAAVDKWGDESFKNFEAARLRCEAAGVELEVDLS